MFDSDLLSIEPGALTMFLLGPGVGESVVLVLPDRRVVVVDSCEHGGVNLPLQLLQELKTPTIDLLVVTHPDLDHIRGLTEIINRYNPRVWRYPFGLLRELLPLLVEIPRFAKNVEAARVNEALVAHLRKTGLVQDSVIGLAWQPPGCGYEVRALAPCQYDTNRARERVRGLIDMSGGKAVLTAKGRRWLEEDAALRDIANMVSIGLAIEWGGRRILLTGDIENGDGKPFSGWRGVLDYLDRPDEGRGYLVEDVDVVKIAHHGSRGAFLDDAWVRHAKSGKTVGVLTTYSPSRLPHREVLDALRSHCKRLGLTVDAGQAFDRAQTAGWIAEVPASPPTSRVPCIQVALRADGTATFAHGAEAAWFT